MKIEIWMDYICPFCYLGKYNLEQALARFPYKDKVEIEYKSFELNTEQSLYTGQNIHQLLADKYGMSIEEAINANERIGNEAAKVGLNFNFEEMKPTNTFDAHRLTKYAKTVGKEKEIIEKIFQGYFTNAKLISDYGTLSEIAITEGLDKDLVLAVLKDRSVYGNDVRSDEAKASEYGITGVPFFLINQKYAISGAQPADAILDVLQKVWENVI